MADRWFRGTPGEPGERGQLGDHGQDGRPGPQGEQGPPGRSAEDVEVDRDIREALALALSEKTRKKDDEVDYRLRSADRRLLWTYALVAFALLVYSFVDERSESVFQKQIVAVCQDNREGNLRVNEVLDRLAENARSNPARTEQERVQIAADYAGLRLPVPTCPPGG